MFTVIEEDWKALQKENGLNFLLYGEINEIKGQYYLDMYLLTKESIYPYHSSFIFSSEESLFSQGVYGVIKVTDYLKPKYQRYDESLWEDIGYNIAIGAFIVSLPMIPPRGIGQRS